MFLCVEESTVGELLCCGVGTVQCLLNLLYYVICWVFLGVVETIVGLLLCSGVGFVPCLFNFLQNAIWWLHSRLQHQETNILMLHHWKRGKPSSNKVRKYSFFSWDSWELEHFVLTEFFRRPVWTFLKLKIYAFPWKCEEFFLVS